MAKAKSQPVIQADDDTLYCERCAGIDVRKKLLVICLCIGRKTESSEYGTTTGEIREMVVNAYHKARIYTFFIGVCLCRRLLLAYLFKGRVIIFSR